MRVIFVDVVRSLEPYWMLGGPLPPDRQRRRPESARLRPKRAAPSGQSRMSGAGKSEL